MTLAKIKSASTVAVVVVALGVMTAIVKTNSAPGTKPTSPGMREVRGNSTYSVLGTNGAVTWGDTNEFSVVIEECAWRMALHNIAYAHSPTQVGDDGTNYIVFAPGSAGTSRIAGQLTRYEDSASAYESGREYPRHHGSAVWLLFASNCAMPPPAGDIGNVLGSTAELDWGYERLDDPEKNALGPSMVRIFAKVRVGETRTNVLVAELEVMDAERKGGYAVPRNAELRMVHQRPGERSRRVLAIYRLSNISLKRDVARTPWPPVITRPTLIQDLRHPFYRFEYVSTNWTTAEEGMQLMRSGRVRSHGPE